MHPSIKKTFFITMGFFFVLSTSLFFVKLHGQNKEISTHVDKQEIKDISCQIKELKEMKRGYEGRALYHETQAIRIQFQEDQLLVAKRHWKLAEANRKIAKKIQEDIDKLRKRRQALLHGAKMEITC